MNRVEVVTGRAIYQAFSPPMLYMLGAIGLAAWGPVAQGIEQQPSKRIFRLSFTKNSNIFDRNPCKIAENKRCTDAYLRG